jgi:hypothetical protein
MLFPTDPLLDFAPLSVSRSGVFPSPLEAFPEPSQSEFPNQGNDDGGTGEAGDSGAVGSIVDLLRGQMREAVDANMAAEREILALRAEVKQTADPKH